MEGRSALSAGAACSVNAGERGIPAPLAAWFHRCVGRPTSGQRLAWPRIASGQSLLLTAPTGSGKTWAAVLPLLAHWRGDGLRCIYLAPLRALCNDLYFRLSVAFGEFEHVLGWRPTVGLQTGDVSQYRRKRLWSAPPHLLITTPESLALLLARSDASERFHRVSSVIVDEVHALAATKRGADLSLSLERLYEWTARPAQRIGLSATASPRPLLARWLQGSGSPVEVVAVPEKRPWQLRIQHLGNAIAEGKFLSTLLDELEAEITHHRTTILFTNARSIAERITWALRRRRPDWAEQIAIHHGSLAADLRGEVEARMQAGQIRLVISSSSLELGVDLGFVDQVLMVHPPGGASRLLQRLGRCGHRPGGSPQGVLYTTSLEELWEAVVTRDAGQLACLEPIRLVEAPLDVLCQHLLGMVVAAPRTAAELWQRVRGAYSFRSLTFVDFVRCLDYLTGGGEANPMPARLRLRDHRFHLATARTARVYRQNTGTITTEEQSEIRLADGRVLGNLNTAWADRLEAGERFLLGGHTFLVRKKSASGIEVESQGGTPAFSRWMGGYSYLSPVLAERIWRLRHRLKEALLEGPPSALAMLRGEYQVEEHLARCLVDQAEAQERVSEIPNDDLLVESWASDDGETVFHAFHLPFTPAMGEGLGRVLAARLGCGPHPGLIAGRLGFILAVAAQVDVNPSTLRTHLAANQLERELDRALASAPIFQIKFSEVVRTGLMLLRQPHGRPRKVGGANWAGDRLLQWLRFVEPDFALLEQSHRELRAEIYHGDRIRAWLEQLPHRAIRQRWLREAAPFAAEWFFNPFQPPLQLAEPHLDAALLRLHRERETAHASA